jgi:DNA-binding transcriptional ArsR family regulator
MAEAKIVESSNAEKRRDFLKKYLEEKRCAMTRELADALGGINRNVLRRLLLRLERRGVVKSRRVGRVVLWCVAGP